MSSVLEDRIRARALAFATELDALIREAALQAITDTLLCPTGAFASERSTGRRIGKRGSAEIVALMDQVRIYVGAHPGQGVEVISRDLGLPSKDLALPIKRLLATGGIVKEGEKRSTRYFPA
jgi:hypothetical protein